MDKDWEMDIGMGLTGAQAWKVQAFICSYRASFAFKFIDFEGYKGKPVRIQLVDDHPIFRRPYKLSLLEIDGVELRCKELLDARLVDLSNGKYAYATVMPTKNDVLGN